MVNEGHTDTVSQPRHRGENGWKDVQCI